MFTRLKQKIDTYSVISFDIFDTLIMRPYNKPVDVFKHIEISHNKPNFQKLRQQAEQTARKKYCTTTKHEVTLDEIYSCLPTQLQALKNIEITQELRNCYRDSYMFEVFNYAKMAGKRIVIASDMYLDKDTVEAILKNAGYDGYEKLFLSSDTLTSKHTGSMFQDIIKYIDNNELKILHIGDNPHADRDMAKKNGIDCYLYQSATAIHVSQDEGYFKSLDTASDEVSCSILKGLAIKRAFKKNDIWADFGYKYAGLMLVGYCEWLYNELKKNNTQNAFFAARDSYIPFQIFKEKYPNIKSQYFYASRRAYLFAGCKKIMDILSTLVISADEGNSFESYWDSLSIDDDSLRNIFFEAFAPQTIITKENKEQLKKFFLKNEQLFLAYGKKERNDVLDYLNGIGLSKGKNAIVDIGWRGTIQSCIMNIFELEKHKVDITGYYLATYPLYYNNINTKGWLLCEGVPHERADIITPVFDILELLLSAPHLGCLKIKSVDNKPQIIPQESSHEELKRIACIEKISQGVLDFVQDFDSVTKDMPLPTLQNVALLPFVDYYKNLNSDMQQELGAIKYVKGIGDNKTFKPLYPAFATNSSIGVVFSCLDSVRTQETDFLNRLLNVGSQDNIPNIIPISHDGFILSKDLKKTPINIRDNDFKFIISVDYNTIKMTDNFSYYAFLKSPQDIIQSDNYPDLLSNIISHDDFLISDEDDIKNSLRLILSQSPRDFDNSSVLAESQCTLEKHIVNLIDNHENRQAALEKSLYAQDTNTNTLVIAYVDDLEINSSLENRIKHIFINLERQYEKNMTLVLACHKGIVDNLYDFLEPLRFVISFQIKSFKIYDDSANKLITRGQMLWDILTIFKHDYFMILNGTEKLFKDHITILKRTLEDKPQATIAHSGMFIDLSDDTRHKLLGGHLHKQHIYNNQYFEQPCYPAGAFLMRASVKNYIPEYMLSYLDGAEIPTVLNMAIFHHNQTIEFSQRITLCHIENKRYNFPMVIDYSRQLNVVRGLVQNDYKKWCSQAIDINKITDTLDNIPVPKTPHNQEEMRVAKRVIRKLKMNILILNVRYCFAFTSAKRKDIRRRKGKYTNMLRHQKQLYEQVENSEAV